MAYALCSNFYRQVILLLNINLSEMGKSSGPFRFHYMQVSLYCVCMCVSLRNNCLKYCACFGIVSVEKAAAVAAADFATALSGSAGTACRTTWTAVAATSQGRSAVSLAHVSNVNICKWKILKTLRCGCWLLNIWCCNKDDLSKGSSRKEDDDGGGRIKNLTVS